MFNEEYKQKLAEVIHKEMNDVTQSFQTGVNEVIYYMKTSAFRLQGLGIPDYLHVDGKEKLIEDELHVYYSSGHGLEDCVNRIEKIFAGEEEPISDGFFSIPIITLNEPNKNKTIITKEAIEEAAKDIKSLNKGDNKTCCGDPGDCGQKPCGCAWGLGVINDEAFLLSTYNNFLADMSSEAPRFLNMKDESKVKQLSPEGQFSFWMKKCADVEQKEINAVCQDDLDELRKKAAEYRRLAWESLSKK